MTALQGLAAFIVLSVVAFAMMLFWAVEQIDREEP